MESTLDSLYTEPITAPEVKAAMDAGVSFAEAMGIYHYSRGGYRDFSNYLDFAVKGATFGNGRLNEEQVGDLFLSAISALNKLPKFSGKVYFGQSMELSAGLELFKSGKTFKQRNFTSTSRNEGVARSFANKDLSVGRGAFFVTVESSFSGVDIVPYSYWSEEEVLFKPMTEFKIKNLQKGANEHGQPSYTVLMEELK